MQGRGAAAVHAAVYVYVGGGGTIVPPSVEKLSLCNMNIPGGKMKERNNFLEKERTDFLENNAQPAQIPDLVHNPEDNKNAVNKKRTFFLTKLWHGEYSLPVSFWIFGILVSKILNLLISFIKNSPIMFEIRKRPIVIVIFMVIIVCYEIWTNVGIWNAANKYNGPKIWIILTKIIVCFWWLLFFTAIYDFMSGPLK